MSPLHLLIILGSSREQRLADKVLAWALPTLAADARFTPTVLDPAVDGFPMPMHPRHQAARTALAQRIGAADAFVVITPEYNRGYPAALKDMIDSAYAEWSRKPVAFISYGGVSGGLRAVEQLRPVFAEVQATTVRDSVSLSHPWQWLGKTPSADGARQTQSLTQMLDQLQWWAGALRVAREADAASSRPPRSNANVTLINTFSAAPGQGDALLALQMAETQRLSDIAHEAGWRGNRIYRAQDGDAVTIVTSFASEAAKANWQRSDAFKEHLRRLEKLISLDAVTSHQTKLVASHGSVD